MKKKQFYETPEVDILEVKVEGIICLSDPEDYSEDTEDPFA